MNNLQKKLHLLKQYLKAFLSRAQANNDIQTSPRNISRSSSNETEGILCPNVIAYEILGKYL